MIDNNKLQQIRKIASTKLTLANDPEAFRVVVGMATCGIAAGAKPVFSKLCELVEANHLTNVSIVQVGCVGECAVEPIVEVYDAFGNRTTYAKVNAVVAQNIVEKHLMAHEIVNDHLIENIRAKADK